MRLQAQLPGFVEQGSGQFVNVASLAAHYVVPTGAVLYRNNKSGVFVLDAQAAAHFRPVTVLSRRDDQTSVSGVEPGVRVVVQGAGFLNEGDKVTIAAAPAAARPRSGATAPRASHCRRHWPNGSNW